MALTRRACARGSSKTGSDERPAGALSQRLSAEAPPRAALGAGSVGANIRMIPTSDILFFRAEDKYTRRRSFEALIRRPIRS